MITVRGLSKKYREKVVYENLNLTLETGKISAIMGASGCGKTTLLRILAGLEPCEKGDIRGIPLERISMVFQEDRLLTWLTVEENIQFVLKESYPISELLKKLGLEGLEKAHIGELSGGMQRRVSLARALAYDYDMILLDEPFKGIDGAFKRELMMVLKEEWCREEKTVLFITHDQEEAKFLADYVYQI